MNYEDEWVFAVEEVVPEVRYGLRCSTAGYGLIDASEGFGHVYP